MRTVLPASEVIHVWAAKGQDAARTPQGNVYFSGDTIYSYGSHFPMGRHITHKGKSAVLVTTRTASITTSKHTTWVRGAVRHLDVFHVPLTDAPQTPAGYMEYFRGAIAGSLEAAGKARLLSKKADHFGRAQHYADEANRLATFFGIRRRLKLPASMTDAIAAAAAEKEKADRRNAKAIAERAKRAAADLETARAAALAAVHDWRAGRIAHIPGIYSVRQSLPGDLMRLTADGATVQTSLGATVPTAHVRRAVRILQRLRENGRDYTHTGASLHVGHYTVSRMTADMVAVGCHNFTWDEVQRIGETIDAMPSVPAAPTTVADVPPGLTFTADGTDVARIKRWARGTADDCDSFFVGQRDGEYAEVWAVASIVPGLDVPARRIMPPPGVPGVPPAVQCPGCNGRGSVPGTDGERCFDCQGYGVVTPAAVTSEGGAM